MSLNKLLEKTDFPAEAAAAVTQNLEKIKDTDTYQALVRMMLLKVDFPEIESEVDKAAEVLKMHKYVFQMVLLCDCIGMAEERYLQRGVSAEVFWATANDLTYKVIECKQNYGFWGISVFSWYWNLFEAVIFKLGRLEFIRKKYKDNTFALDVHIPSSGPLPHEAVIESYQMAYRFFENTHGDYMAFRCSSWLLNPDYRGTIFKENSNTFAFADDFTVFHYVEQPDFPDAWRIFNMPYDGNPDALPGDTGMQRAFKEYLKNGNKPGLAVGGFMFDGQKIDKEKSELLRGKVHS